MTSTIERALGYVRASAHNAGSHGDLIRQGKRIVDHCAQRQIDLVHIYRDEGRSGTCEDRPGLQGLIEHAMRPGSGISEIAVDSLSRLFRDRDLLELYFGKLKQGGIRIVAIAEHAEAEATSDPVTAAKRAS